MNYVGIDDHRQYSHLTVMDQEGQTIRAGRVPNIRVEIEKFLEGLEALEALLKTYRHLETRFGESAALVEKLYEESREAQLIAAVESIEAALKDESPRDR